MFGRRRHGETQFLADFDLGLSFGFEMHGGASGIDFLLRRAFVFFQVDDEDAGGWLGLDLIEPFRVGDFEVSLWRCFGGGGMGMGEC